jgi:hypothetical protein
MTDEELAAIVDEYRHDDRSHMGEVLTALAKARTRVKEGDTHRLVVKELAELFDWSDRTPLHALMHVTNAVLNLRVDLSTEKVLREKAEANYAFMVKKAADQSLDGYRELGQRCAQLEAQRDAAQARLAGYQSAPVHMAATVLKGRLDKAEAEIVRLKALFPACEFCGTEMPAGEKCPC